MGNWIVPAWILENWNPVYFGANFNHEKQVGESTESKKLNLFYGAYIIMILACKRATQKESYHVSVLFLMF